MTSPNKKSRLSKSQCSKEIELDRISDLPGNVTDQILSYLSIKESAKTSLLSTKWRRKWESVPSLVFDDQSFSADKLVTGIDRVLLLHVGPVHKFEMSHSQFIPDKIIDTWILYLSRRSVKDLVLKSSKNGYYNSSNCLFSCQSLTRLEIAYCVLTPPSSFNGFKILTSLDIRSVIVARNELENLISSSPLLENLALGDLYNITHLNINAPNLRSFAFEGPFCCAIIENTPCLAQRHMHTIWCPKRNYQNGHDSNLLNLMADMPLLGRLTIEGCYLVYLAKGDIPKELPIRYTYLTYLSIAIYFTVSDEISAFLCLLRSFPNLQELHITSRWEKIDATISNNWVANDLNFPMSRLRLVKMIHFCGTEVENELIKFMLLISPALKSMTVELGPDDKGKFEMAQKMLRFKRASPQAEIIF